MLKVKEVTKSFDDLKVVDNLSFEVKEGEIFGLLGVNGAGKTTTFRMIMNLLTPDSGNITLNNKKIDYSQTDKIGYLTEENSLLLKLSVEELLIYYGKLKSMNEKEIKRKIDYYLEEFNIKDLKTKKIKELSKGNKQKIQFISAIINNPKLLILDEPFSGLDPINIDLFIKIIKKLQKQKVMIIFSSHQMNHVELFCEKLLILNNGKTVLQGDLKEIKESFNTRKIFLKAQTSLKELKNIKHVKNVIKKGDEFELTIERKIYIDEVFKEVSKLENVRKFEVKELSLHEIFTRVVGDNNE